MPEPSTAAVEAGLRALQEELLSIERLASPGESHKQRLRRIVKTVYMAMSQGQPVTEVRVEKVQRRAPQSIMVRATRKEGSYNPTVRSRATQRTTLTPRERDVLFHIAMDKTKEDIAKELKISPLTVKNHIQKILAVYDCRTRVGIVMQAIVLGDLTMDDIREHYRQPTATATAATV